MKKVLRSAKKALVGLLGHGEMDVKISVTSCLTEIMRITAPNEPLEDDNMKVLNIYQHLPFLLNNHMKSLMHN